MVRKGELGKIAKRGRWVKKSEEKRLDKERRAIFSETLSTELKKAARAARFERAVCRGALALWAGGVFVGTLAWRARQDASTVERNIAIVGAAAIAVAFFSVWRRRAEAQGRRALALLAARRLENRFEEQKGVLVAAVDFCEDSLKGATEPSTATAATSEALRDATVVAATRWFEKTASEMNAAELRAVLTDLPIKRFRKIGLKRLACALGILLNGALWASCWSWEEGKTNERPPKKVALSNGNRGIKENIEEETGTQKATIEERGKKEENEEDEKASDLKKEETGEEISLSALELLISELAQNAEIAETLQSELERASVEQDAADAKPVETPQLLQLARELKANLARPERGLAAQTRRLKERARRERWAVEERLKREKINISGENGKIDGVGELGEVEKRLKENAQNIGGKEIAVAWLEARLTKFELELSAENRIGDVASLGLSRVLRSERAEERKETLSEAASRVGEWGATLRREETAARILSESWRFGEATRRRELLLERVLEENRGALTRFAGRLTIEYGATEREVEALEEAKRRFAALATETRRVENEGVAIVERLRERLQSEEAREFIEFVKNDVGLAKGVAIDGAEADAAAFNWINDVVSRSETKWAEITERVENNRFGRAAERLEREVALSLSETTSLNGESLSTERRNKEEEDEKEREKEKVAKSATVEIKEVERIEGKAVEENRNVESTPEERRFSALAALLTRGVGAKTVANGNAQPEADEEVALLEKKRNGEFAINEEEKTNEPFRAASQESEDDALSQKEGKRQENAKDGKAGEDDTTVEKVKSCDDATGGGLEDSDGALDGEKASAAETGKENGNLDDVGGAGRGKKESKENAKTGEKQEVNEGFNGELPPEARRRFERTETPEIDPEYAEKIRLYRRRILNEKR